MLTKIILTNKIINQSKSLVLFKPEWNVSGVTTVYTKNGQNPLQVSDLAYSTQSYIPIDRSCVLRFVGIKVDHYASPIYDETFYMNDIFSRRDIQVVNESLYTTPGTKSDIYDTSTRLILSDGTSCRGRYLPNLKSLDKIKNYKYVKVTGKLKDRIDLIAYEYLGNSQLWWIIAECNRDTILDPTNIPVNTMIRVPSTEELFTKGLLRKDTDACEVSIFNY